MSNNNSGGNSRNRNSNKSRGQNQKSNGQKGQNQSQPKKRNRSRQKKVDPKLLWGDEARLPSPDSYVTSTPDTLAVVRSLGEAPIPGKPAEPYFALVYERAAMLATVLSHAGGLDDMTPLDAPIEDEDEEEPDEVEAAAEEVVEEDDELEDTD